MPISGGEGSPSRCIVFVVSGQVCAIPVERVREVVPMAELAHPPGMPDLLEGVLNLAGNAVAVVRLWRLFDLPSPSFDSATAIVVLRGMVPPVGLLVDRVTAVRSVPVLLPVRGRTTFNDGVAGVFEDGGGPVHLLSAERLLLREEQARLAALQAREQARLGGLRGGAAPDGARSAPS